MRPGAITTPEPLLAPGRFAHGQKISGFAVETSSLTTAFGGLFSSAGASWAYATTAIATPKIITSNFIFFIINPFDFYSRFNAGLYTTIRWHL